MPDVEGAAVEAHGWVGEPEDDAPEVDEDDGCEDE